MAPATRRGISASANHVRDAEPELVRIGIVSGIHGLRGAIRIRTDNPDSQILLRCATVILAREGVSVTHSIVSAQRLNGSFKIALAGIGTADAAEVLKGSVVFVSASELPAAAPGEFYYFQAIGCEVMTTAGDRVGIIEDVVYTGANEVWVVRNGEVEHLVPVIADIVKSADWSGRRIILEPVPGLLD
jgi:16S rRNA processing protein RimM